MSFFKTALKTKKTQNDLNLKLKCALKILAGKKKTQTAMHQKFWGSQKRLKSRIFATFYKNHFPRRKASDKIFGSRPSAEGLGPPLGVLTPSPPLDKTNAHEIHWTGVAGVAGGIVPEECEVRCGLSGEPSRMPRGAIETLSKILPPLDGKAGLL